MPLLSTDRDVAATKRLERSDAVANRSRILQAAHLLLHEKGADFSMDELALRAGVGKGTLYRRFHDKAELCLALIVENQPRAFRAEGGSAMLRLEAFLENLVSYHWQNAELLSVLHAQTDKFNHPAYKPQLDVLAELMKEVVAERNLPVSHPGRLALQVAALLDAPLVLYYKRQGLHQAEFASQTMAMIMPVFRAQLPA